MATFGSIILYQLLRERNPQPEEAVTADSAVGQNPADEGRVESDPMVRRNPDQL